MYDAQDIHSDESLLLAYAAGELEGQALLQFEARLDKDVSLRQRAQEVRQDYVQAQRAVAALDRSYRTDTRRSLARIDRLLSEWEAEQAQIPAPIPLYRWHPPRWSYAAAAAIALLIGFCFWWANNTPNTDMAQIPSSEPAQEVAVAPSGNPSSNPASDNSAISTPAVASDTTPIPMPLAFQDASSENSDQLSDLEHDVSALSNDQTAASNGANDSDQ